MQRTPTAGGAAKEAEPGRMVLEVGDSAYGMGRWSFPPPGKAPRCVSSGKPLLAHRQAGMCGSKCGADGEDTGGRSPRQGRQCAAV